MRQKKKRLEFFNFYNITAITAHLEKMAAQGWMLEKICNTGWIYSRIEPQNLRFAVSYYPKASEFDPEPSDGQREFLDFCAYTGWKLACTSGQMQIFYNEWENPTPIETEPALEVQAIHASVEKSFLPSYIVLILMGLFYGWIFLMALLGNPVATLANPTLITLGVVSVCLKALCITELVLYYRWHSRAEEAAENGFFLTPPNTVGLQKGILTVVFLAGAYFVVENLVNGDNLRKWIMLVMFVYIAVVYALIDTSKDYFKKKKASRNLNRALTGVVTFLCGYALMQGITHGTLWASEKNLFDSQKETYEHNGVTWVLHNDELPLVVEDLVEADPAHYIKERSGNESIFLGNFRLRQQVRFDIEDASGVPEMEYRMVHVKLPALYDICKDRLIFEGEGLRSRMVQPEPLRTYQPEDPAPWGAEEAYRLLDSERGFENTYLLCYSDMLIELEMDWEPTVEQKAIAANKLMGMEGRE